MLSRVIPWNMPLVTCIFVVYTLAKRLVCIPKIQVNRIHNFVFLTVDVVLWSNVIEAGN